MSEERIEEEKWWMSWVGGGGEEDGGWAMGWVGEKRGSNPHLLFILCKYCYIHNYSLNLHSVNFSSLVHVQLIS